MVIIVILEIMSSKPRQGYSNLKQLSHTYQGCYNNQTQFLQQKKNSFGALKQAIL